MKKTLIAVVSALALYSASAAEWLTDLPKAQAQAKKENKLVMLDFTGSDFCVQCKILKKKVFDTKEFATYASTNLVLVEVDFPEKKKLPDEQKKANDALAEVYKIEGYPTIVVLDKEGKKVGVLRPIDSETIVVMDGEDKKVSEYHYAKGSPKTFIAELKNLTK